MSVVIEKNSTTEKVYRWLEGFHREDYFQTFINNGFDNLEICSKIDSNDLNAMGITLLGHRKMILYQASNIPGSPCSSSTNIKSPIITKDRILSESHNVRANAAKQNKVPYRAEDFEFLLVRHGESQANVDKSIYSKEADHATQLSKQGEIQSEEAGKRIKEYFETHYGCKPAADWYCRIWTSPYKRARQTANILQANAGGWISDIRESIFLGEQQFGLFEGVDWANGEVDARFPNELQFYNKCSSFGGRFWASLPMGESRFDVCQRVYLTLSAMHRDGIKHVIIVSHGVTLRAWLMMYMDLTPEWFEESQNPVNCSIRMVKNGKDHGYIWPQDPVKEIADTDLLNKPTTGKKKNVQVETLPETVLITNEVSITIASGETTDEDEKMSLGQLMSLGNYHNSE